MKSYEIQYIQVRATAGTDLNKFLMAISELALSENRVVVGMHNGEKFEADPEKIVEFVGRHNLNTK